LKRAKPAKCGARNSQIRKGSKRHATLFNQFKDNSKLIVREIENVANHLLSVKITKKKDQHHIPSQIKIEAYTVWCIFEMTQIDAWLRGIMLSSDSLRQE
jgi:hypothetical protein